MKYIRQSVFSLTGGATMTVVIPEESLTTDVYTAATYLRFTVKDSDTASSMVDIEIFECEGGLSAASIEGALRAKGKMDDTQRHKLTLRDFLISNVIITLKPGGRLNTTRPAPLSREDIFDVFREVKAHPEYKGQVFTVFDVKYRPVLSEAEEKTS